MSARPTRAAVFRALAEPNRVAILQLIRSTERAAGEIAEHFRSTTRSAISQHLRVLTDAGLISERRDGTRRLYSIRREGFDHLRSFLDPFWAGPVSAPKEPARRRRSTGTGLRRAKRPTPH